MNPAKQTSSTPASSRAACTAMSKSKRLLKSLCLITWKKNGIEQNKREILLQVSRQQRMDDDLSVEEPPR